MVLLFGNFIGGPANGPRLMLYKFERGEFVVIQYIIIFERDNKMSSNIHKGNARYVYYILTYHRERERQPDWNKDIYIYESRQPTAVVQCNERERGKNP